MGDFNFVCEIPLCAEYSGWAKNLWLFGKALALDEDKLEEFALLFWVVRKLLHARFWKRVKSSAGYSLQITGLLNADQIYLLSKWWSVTKFSEFENYALSIAKDPIDGLHPWRDGDAAIELIYQLTEGGILFTFL